MKRFRNHFGQFLLIIVSGASSAPHLLAGDLAKPAASDPATLFARDRIIAWCIVPFDAKKRGPEERAAMLERLGFKHFAYDWRAEHIPTFDAELNALQRHGIALDAFWFPSSLNDQAKQILALLERRGVKTQLWVSGGGEPTKSPEEQQARVAKEAARIRPIAEAAARSGCTVGLYNHGGWFGEPENQLAVLEAIGLPNVGIVYNLHHGHAHVDRFAEILAKLKPHLLAVNLNGMQRDGDRQGQKILPLGQGELDLSLLKTLVASGYRGPIGILGHTQDDAEERLQDNLDGLDWLLKQLAGKPAGPRPVPRTYKATAKKEIPATSNGWLVDGRAEYRTLPLTVNVRAAPGRRSTYNILLACDPKSSGTHWELFTAPKSGHLEVYLPGMQPDHLRSTFDVCDGKTHEMTLSLETTRVRLLVDGQQVAEQKVTSRGKPSVPGALAIGRLVEGTLDCEGPIESIELRKGALGDKESAIIGLWKFSPQSGDRVADQSSLANPAQRQTAVQPAKGAATMPPPGVHLTSADPRLRIKLIDRSPGDSYLAVKADGNGRLFVGGRESLFVFEPDGQGGYRPRQTLFDFGDDAIIIGIEMRGDDLLVLTSSALYLLPEGRTKHSGLKPLRLLSGLPLDLHVSFHCLAWGPLGELYFDHGDPFLAYNDWSRPDHWGHWTLFTGVNKRYEFPFTGVGNVLRMDPAGYGLRAVASGLRGPVGLTFDSDWNLFTNDNDHESQPDRYAPARLLHATPAIDFGWPRGWIASKSPDRSDLIEPVSADLGRGVPCDLVFHEESTWPEEYRGRLLMCRWDRHAVTSYKLKERGASFSADESALLTGDNDARPVGIAATPDGRLLVTCLYMTGNQASPYCPSDLYEVTVEGVTPKANVKDISEMSAADLWAELASGSWERRRRAHHEIHWRGGEVRDEAGKRFAVAEESDPLLPHLIWLGGGGSKRLMELARSKQPKVQLQALRLLALHSGHQQATELYRRILQNGTPPAQLTALEYFLNNGHEGADRQPLPLPLIVRLASCNDTYLRQTAARVLAECASETELESLIDDDDAHARLAGVLATGMKLTTPPLDLPPPAALPLFYPKENAFFKTQITYADDPKPVDLRDLGRIGAFTMAEWWRTIPSTPEQQRMFDSLAGRLDDSEPTVALQAAYYLSLLHDERVEAKLATTVHRLHRQRLAAYLVKAIEQAWLLGPFADDAHKPTPLPLENGVDLAGTVPSADGPQRWRQQSGAGGKLTLSSKALAAKPWSAYACFTFQSRSRQEALFIVDCPPAVQVWQSGRPVTLQPTGTSQEALLDLQPGTNEIVVQVRGDSSAAAALSMRWQAGEGVAAGVPELIDASLLSARLLDAAKGGAGTAVPEEFAKIDWVGEARRGDASRGRQLFGTLGCVKCHAISPDQAGRGAPSLADARRRLTVPHLVESILLPSKQVAEPFRASTILTDDGKVLNGLVVAESAGTLELLQADGSRLALARSKIEHQARNELSPMPQGIVKTPDELRALLTYLLLDRPLPP